MKVKLATQIFSHSVAKGIHLLCHFKILPAKCLPTATYLEKFNDLFDAFNSNQDPLEYINILAQKFEIWCRKESGIYSSSKHHGFPILKLLYHLSEIRQPLLPQSSIS